jgi:hypothetical protein
MTVSSGTVTDMSSGNLIWQGYPGARGDYGYYPTYAGYYNFGFNFNFDGTNYSYCVIYTSGIISLGPNVNSNYANRNIAAVNTPTLAPWWTHMTITGDGCGGNGTPPEVWFVTLGSAPNRRFIVQWKDFEITSRFGGPIYGYGYRGTFETRIYESAVATEAGKVEFFYEYMGDKDCDNFYYGSTAAHIGMATSSSNYLFVGYSGSTPSVSYTGTPASINAATGSSNPANNALYVFQKLPNVQLSA